MDVTRKEEYEIDPNSSFNKLKKLQKALKEETALRETFAKNKDEILRKIDTNCYQYYKNKVAIQEIFDQTKINRQNDKELQNIHYELVENTQSELPQCYDPLYKLMFYFRASNSLMLSLIQVCDSNLYDDLANFVAHFFYQNIFSSKLETENLLVLIYLLLEKEVDKIKNESSSVAFLDVSVSFVSKLLRSLTRKNEVRSYLELILNKMIIDLENLNGKSTVNNSFINMEISRIKDYLKEKGKMKINKNKKIIDPKGFLTKDIKCSNIFTNLNQNLRLIKNKDANTTFYDESPQDLDYHIFNNDEEQDNELYQDIEHYFNSSGIFDNTATNPNDPQIDDDKYNKNYSIDLTKDEIMKKIGNEKSTDMKDFFAKQGRMIKNDNDIFTNKKFLSDLTTSKDSKDSIEKILLLYKYSFEKTKKYLDNIFRSIIEHKSSIPYIIKCICLIIDKLITIKFPSISEVEKNAFIGEFFFGNLIFPILNNPSYNGIVVKQSDMNEYKKSKFVIITKIMKKLLRGSFFNASNESETMYTIFNTYFIEIMPCVFDLFSNLKNVKLPPFIEKLIQDKANGVDPATRNIEYNFLKENPEEQIEHQSMCFTWTEFLIFYESIKENENILAPDKSSIFYKTYKKMFFHEDTLHKKIEDNEENNVKSYIFLSKTNFSEKLAETISAKKSQKFSFQSGRNDLKENENEIFILARVKYSINTIIKHLNILTRANFFVDESESTKNFVKGLNKMIELEGFSEMLKEKTIPLAWFGLYLQSNIENIPQSRQRANFSLLYQELVDDSYKNLEEIQKDESLNLIYTQLKISEKLIEIEKNTMKKLKKTRTKFRILNFITQYPIKICLKTTEKDGQLNSIKIDLASAQGHGKLKFDIFDRKKNCHRDCQTIQDFTDAFPSILGGVDTLELLSFEKSIGLDTYLEKCFTQIIEVLSKEDMLKKYEEEEKYEIKKLIQNYIHKKLYSKIYPEMAVQADIAIFQKCFKLDWLKITDLDESFKNINMNVLNLAIGYIKQMDNEKTPFEKLQSFSKSYEIINSLIEFCKIDSKSNKLGLFIFSTLKAQPYMLSSNLLYIQMYLTKDLRTEYYEKLINLVDTIIKKIVLFSYEDLKGITKEQFEENCVKLILPHK